MPMHVLMATHAHAAALSNSAICLLMESSTEDVISEMDPRMVRKTVDDVFVVGTAVGTLYEGTCYVLILGA